MILTRVIRNHVRCDKCKSAWVFVERPCRSCPDRRRMASRRGTARVPTVLAEGVDDTPGMTRRNVNRSAIRRREKRQ